MVYGVLLRREGKRRHARRTRSYNIARAEATKPQAAQQQARGVRRGARKGSARVREKMVEAFFVRLEQKTNNNNPTNDAL